MNEDDEEIDNEILDLTSRVGIKMKKPLAELPTEKKIKFRDELRVLSEIGEKERNLSFREGRFSLLERELIGELKVMVDRGKLDLENKEESMEIIRSLERTLARRRVKAWWFDIDSFQDEYRTDPYKVYQALSNVYDEKKEVRPTLRDLNISPNTFYDVVENYLLVLGDGFSSGKPKFDRLEEKLQEVVAQVNVGGNISKLLRTFGFSEGIWALFIRKGFIGRNKS